MISSFDVIAPQTNNIFIIVHVDIKRQYYIIPSQIKPLIYERAHFLTLLNTIEKELDIHIYK